MIGNQITAIKLISEINRPVHLPTAYSMLEYACDALCGFQRLKSTFTALNQTALGLGLLK